IAQRWLGWESSPIDWCEENYDIILTTAEFTNTISNIVILMIPAYCLYMQLWDSFTMKVSLGPKIFLWIMALTGLASTYFHWTLSLLGQFLDEVLIIWNLCVAYNFFLPNKYRPAVYNGTMSHVLSAGVAILLTLCWFISPSINTFWLIIFYLPLLCVQITECLMAKKSYFLRLNRIAIATSLTALFFWMLDQWMCDTWIELEIPGLHNIWHLLSPFAVYISITAFAYKKVKVDFPNVKASIRFSPSRILGLPYVLCEDCS
ncbi:Ceramidase, partial [Trinorchestia longiramus]